MKFDLHLHTTASDGKFTPAQLVATASSLGFRVIAISDHDTVDGLPEGLETARRYPPLEVVPGVEINCDVSDGEIHVLGYFLDFRDPTLNRELARLRESRVNRGQKMVGKLNGLGLNIRWERVKEIAGAGSVGRPHVAQALYEAGYITSPKEAFDKYIGRHGPAYVEREKITPAGAVRLIAAARGLPVLAHPADIPDLENLLEDLKSNGLVGIEVYYNGYTREVADGLLRIAARHKLVTTGGSDFHGYDTGSGGLLGETSVPGEAVAELFALAGRPLNLKA